MAAKMVEITFSICHNSAIYEPTWLIFKQYVKNKFPTNKNNKMAEKMAAKIAAQNFNCFITAPFIKPI